MNSRTSFAEASRERMESSIVLLPPKIPSCNREYTAFNTSFPPPLVSIVVSILLLTAYSTTPSSFNCNSCSYKAEEEIFRLTNFPPSLSEILRLDKYGYASSSCSGNTRTEEEEEEAGGGGEKIALDLPLPFDDFLFIPSKDFRLGRIEDPEAKNP